MENLIIYIIYFHLQMSIFHFPSVSVSHESCVQIAQELLLKIMADVERHQAPIMSIGFQCTNDGAFDEFKIEGK